MTDHDEAPSAPRISSRLLGGVDVALTAYLGDATMTVAELAALKADDVVPLAAPLGRSVELRLNAMAVARGELVAVGDAFGVRLTEIVPCDD